MSPVLTQLALVENNLSEHFSCRRVIGQKRQSRPSLIEFLVRSGPNMVTVGKFPQTNGGEFSAG